MQIEDLYLSNKVDNKHANPTHHTGEGCRKEKKKKEQIIEVLL